MKLRSKLSFLRVQRKLLHRFIEDASDTKNRDRDVEFFPSFLPVESGFSTHTTYLDTVGRPAVFLKYTQLTDRHSGTVYVSIISSCSLDHGLIAIYQVAYKVPFSAHLKKPLAVATAFMGLFVVAFAWKRFDPSIEKK